MKHFCFVLWCLLPFQVFSQSGYYYSRYLSSPEVCTQLKPFKLKYPLQMEDVKAVGMGGTQTANGRFASSMLANPAFLGYERRMIEAFGLQANMPPETFEATSYLSTHMDEFEEAASLNAVWDGINAFFAPGVSWQERLDALNQIQDGMKFTLDTVEKVTGPSSDPETHGMGVLPSVCAQLGHWGFSLYGYGYSGFRVHMSPTLDSLAAVPIPETLEHPMLAVRSVAQMLGILGTTLLKGGETFENEVLPVAFYFAYMDLIGSVGYGFDYKDRWKFGANFKIVNRRFTTDRVAVADYDAILSTAMSHIESGITGVTADLGVYYQSKWGTGFGLSTLNVIPIQEIERHIETVFKVPRVFIDRDDNGEVITNADGDTALVSTYVQVTTDRPLVLSTPFLLNAGLHHPITPNWDVALDWVDIAEQDSRYRSTWERIRMGTEYRWAPWKDKLCVALRTGFSDKKMTGGLGFQSYHHIHLDGAYAWDRFVKSYAYFAQLKVIL